MRSKLLATPMLLALALAVGACSDQGPEVDRNDQVSADNRTEAAPTGGEGGGTEAEGEVAGTFTTEGLAWADAPSELPAGGATIALAVPDGIPHNVTFEGVNGDQPIVQLTGTGEATGDVSLEPGEYTYYCSVPGHRQAGMEGTLTAA